MNQNPYADGGGTHQTLSSQGTGNLATTHEGGVETKPT